MKKIKLILTTTVLFTVLLSGCSTANSSESNKEDSHTTTKQEIQINVNQELNSIDPSNTTDSNSNTVLNNIYEGLYRLDKNNHPVPAGAVTLPDISQDGLTYTIPLRKEAHWSNGTPVVANDYVYAFRRAISSENAAANNYLFESIKNANDIIEGSKKSDTLGITALDDYTLKIKLEKPCSYFTGMLATPPFFPLNESFIKEKGKEFASTNDKALYNGPFILTHFEGPGIGNGWTYEKNKDYWDNKSVKLDKINVSVVKDTGTNLNLFENSQADDINISGEYAKEKANDASYVIEKPSQTVFLGYNQTEETFGNKKMRQAISMVIDRESVTKNLLGSGMKSATGLIFSDFFANEQSKKDFSNESGNHLTTNVNEAKKLWLEGKKELHLKKEAPVSIKLITFDNEDTKKLTEYLQATINDNLPGADISINSYPVSVFMDNAKKQQFDMYLVSWGADFPDPTALFQLFKSDVGHNWGKYSNQEYDAAIDNANGKDALDSNKRWDDLLQAEKILMDDQGITPIYFSPPTYLRNPNLKNVGFHSVGPRFDYKNAYLK